MDNLIIYPDIFNSNVRAFFTGKFPGADAVKISGLLKINKIYFPDQQHTEKVIIVGRETKQETGDALITNSHSILLGIKTADCVPILIQDTEKNVVAAVHAGWRGTASGILKNTLRIMYDSFLCSPEDIVIATGPSIRWCCYRVGYDVVERVSKVSPTPGRHADVFIRKNPEGSFFLDLAAANKLQAMAEGVREKDIWMSEECTCCHPERFYSYRYAKSSTGRQGGFIGIVSPSCCA